jgi:hypothetical protein
MPDCPKCNTHIDHLVYRYDAEIAEEFTITDGLEPILSDMEISQPSHLEGTDTYSCPQCDAFITADLDGAIEFLIGDVHESHPSPHTM